MKVINFFGAPSAGKTTATSGLHYEMKKRWINVEIVQEYAKELLLMRMAHRLSDQMKIFAEQRERLERNLGKTQVAISESPLILSSFYIPPSYPDSFFQMTFDFFHTYDNINFFINRSHSYSDNNRVQNEAQSDYIAKVMKEFLQYANIPYYEITASDANPRYLLYWLVQKNLIEVPDFASIFSDQDIPPEGWIKPSPWNPNLQAKHGLIDLKAREVVKDIVRLPQEEV